MHKIHTVIATIQGNLYLILCESMIMIQDVVRTKEYMWIYRYIIYTYKRANNDHSDKHKVNAQ